jgi:hypothetical protein
LWSDGTWIPIGSEYANVYIQELRAKYPGNPQMVFGFKIPNTAVTPMIPTATTPTPNQKDTTLDVGLVVGISVGAFALVVLVSWGVFIYLSAPSSRVNPLNTKGRYFQVDVWNAI